MDENLNKKEREVEIDIDLKKIFYMMQNKIIFILLFTIIFGVAAGCYTNFFIEPVYSATVKLFVYSNTDRTTSDSSISSSEISASQDLINTYIYVLESDTVMEKVIEDLGLSVTANSIRQGVSASVVEDTQAFQVTVKSNDPNLAARIANSIAKVAPEEIVRVVKAGGVEVIDYAKVPTSASSPNMKKNVVYGAAAGFAISFAAFFLLALFDTTITNTKDLEKEFSVPVLGTVPSLDSNSSSSYPYSYVYSSIQAPEPKPIKPTRRGKTKASDDTKASDLTKPSDDLLKKIKDSKQEGK